MHGSGHGTPSIQPTYEELKPRAAFAALSPLICIQPTYEELKPDTHQLGPDDRFSVSSLPMRN